MMDPIFYRCSLCGLILDNCTDKLVAHLKDRHDYEVVEEKDILINYDIVNLRS